MIDTEYLLTDEDMRHFVVNGYVQVTGDLPASFHRDIYQQIEDVFAEEGNPGNNILPRIPQIQGVFDQPAVQGALTSLLGANYVIHPHRYCHLNQPGSGGQSWHKDDYVFDQNMRHHRFRWVMAFYYPQDVTEDMGPTGILPGVQYHNTISDADPTKSVEAALPLCGQAGTVSIVNFDTWHRATANRSEKKRHMLKFQFTRMQDPHAPSWNNGNPAWQPVDADKHGALSMDVWRWLSGQVSPRMGDAKEDAVSKLLEALQDTSETVRLNAAYTLGAMGESVVPVLMQTLQEEAEASAEQNLSKTPANPQGGNPSELASAHAVTAVGAPALPALLGVLHDSRWSVRAAAADTLGNFGPLAKDAVPALIEALSDENIWVRRNAGEALGTIGASARDAVPTLIKVLYDTNELVRLNAVFAIAKIGHSADGLIRALVEVLSDESRYVRFYAAVALRRIGTPEAHNALLDSLLTTRWCPLTTSETPY